VTISQATHPLSSCRLHAGVTGDATEVGKGMTETETETETGIENDTKAAEEEPEATAMKRSAQVAHAVPAGVTEIETIEEVRFCFRPVHVNF